MKLKILFSMMVLSVFCSGISQAAGNVEAGKTKRRFVSVAMA